MNVLYRCTNLCSLLFALISILGLNSCSKTTESASEIAIKDGLIFKKGELTPYTGEINDTLGGKIFKYSVIEGKKSGEFKTYFKNGQLEMIGQIKENLNQGKWTYYYQSGQVESEGTFKDDLPDGKWKWFYENGNIKEEGNYLKGHREGSWMLYDEEGKIKEERMLKKNQIIEKKKL